MRFAMSPDLHCSGKLALVRRCCCVAGPTVAGPKPGRHPVGPADHDAGPPGPMYVDTIGAGVVAATSTSVLRQATSIHSQCSPPCEVCKLAGQ